MTEPERNQAHEDEDDEADEDDDNNENITCPSTPPSDGAPKVCCLLYSGGMRDVSFDLSTTSSAEDVTTTTTKFTSFLEMSWSQLRRGRF